MPEGLHFWKNHDAASVMLDPDNLFWGINARQNHPDVLIPPAILALYEKVKNQLKREIKEFRFGQELTAIYIDPTDRCNASCSYCYISPETRKNGRSMTQEELDRVLEKIAVHFKGQKRKQVIIFHASEPLLVKEILFNAIRRYKHVFKFGIQTNALLMEKKDVVFLKKHRVGVGISLDSFSPAVNNRQRFSREEKGNFAKAVKAIEWFKGYAGLNVITTITKFNVRDLPGLVKFLHGKKVPCVLMNPVRFTRAPIAALKPDDAVLTRCFIKAVNTAVRLSKTSSHKIIVGNFTNTLLAIIAPVARRLMCDISPCGGGRCFFTITARGDMIPCGEFTGLKQFCGGNIFTHSIPEAMQSRAFRKVRERMVEKISECKTCAFRNICGAPCPAELHSLGDMYQKAVFCEFYKNIIKFAFQVIAQDKVRYLVRSDSWSSLTYKYCLN